MRDLRKGIKAAAFVPNVIRTTPVYLLRYMAAERLTASSCSDKDSRGGLGLKVAVRATIVTADQVTSLC